MAVRSLFSTALTLVAFEASASADNPAVQACSGKAKGDACTFSSPDKEPGGDMKQRDVSGTCQDDKCCELDYSKGSPPTSNCVPCLACKEGGGAAAGDEGGAAAKSGPNAGEVGTASRPGDDPPAGTSNGKRGCTIGTHDPTWALLLLPLLAIRRTQRRQRL